VCNILYGNRGNSMGNMRSLMAAVLNAKSDAEAQILFDVANNAMPDNTIGHSVPVFYVDGKTGELMVRHPDGRIEATGKFYSI
jgi:hypothetical protein